MAEAEQGAGGDQAAAGNEVMTDVCFVRKKLLDELKAKVAAKEDVSPTLLINLTSGADIDPEETMVPIVTTEFGVGIEDIDAMVENLGSKAVAELFVKGEELVAKLEPACRPEPMAAREWLELAAAASDAQSEESEEERKFKELEVDYSDGDDDEDGCSYGVSDGEIAREQEHMAKRARKD